MALRELDQQWPVIVGDVRFVTHGPDEVEDYLVATDGQGQRLWSWNPKMRPRSAGGGRVAALPGRVYVQVGRDVACIVESDAPG